MKELKFRAWHKEREQMLTVECIDLVSKLEDNDAPGFVVHKEDTGTPDSYEGPGEPCYATGLADVILMQYTGNKSKHGVELYEGDVIEYMTWNCDTGKNDAPLKYEVAWSSNFIAYRLYPVDHNVDVEFVAEEMDGSEFEIIGNIYETPEFIGI